MVKRSPKCLGIERYPIKMNDKGREEARHKGRYEDSDGSALEEQGRIEHIRSTNTTWPPKLRPIVVEGLIRLQTMGRRGLGRDYKRSVLRFRATTTKATATLYRRSEGGARRGASSPSPGVRTGMRGSTLRYRRDSCDWGFRQSGAAPDAAAHIADCVADSVRGSRAQKVVVPELET